MCSLGIVLDQEHIFTEHLNLKIVPYLLFQLWQLRVNARIPVHFHLMQHLLLFMCLFVVASTTALLPMSVYPWDALHSANPCFVPLLGCLRFFRMWNCDTLYTRHTSLASSPSALNLGFRSGSCGAGFGDPRPTCNSFVVLLWVWLSTEDLRFAYEGELVVPFACTSKTKCLPFQWYGKTFLCICALLARETLHTHFKCQPNRWGDDNDFRVFSAD